MKVVPIKGRYKGHVVRLMYRIAGTEVFRATCSVPEPYTSCYIHNSDISLLDSTMMPQTSTRRALTLATAYTWETLDRISNVFMILKNKVSNLLHVQK